MLDELKKLIGKYVDVDQNSITEESRFVEDLGFTSYDFMTLVGEIEDVYDVEVDEREVAEVRTVAEAIEYIKSLQ